MNLKTLALRYSVNREHFENIAFRKDGITMWFPCPQNEVMRFQIPPAKCTRDNIKFEEEFDYEIVDTEANHFLAF